MDTEFEHYRNDLLESLEGMEEGIDVDWWASEEGRIKIREWFDTDEPIAMAIAYVLMGE